MAASRRTRGPGAAALATARRPAGSGSRPGSAHCSSTSTARRRRTHIAPVTTAATTCANSIDGVSLVVIFDDPNQTAVGTVVLATYCGLTVDTDLRVLDVWGRPIERLYAAGEVIGGFHGGGYMTGTSIGKSGIFGRLAGTHAAAEESDLEW